MTRDQDPAVEDRDSSAQDKPEKVPATAENFEHTLRRIARQKAEKRAQQPGLYR